MSLLKFTATRTLLFWYKIPATFLTIMCKTHTSTIIKLLNVTLINMKAVIFDLDETLINSKKVHINVTDQVLKEMGIKGNIKSIFGQREDDILKTSFPNLSSRKRKLIQKMKRKLYIKNIHKVKLFPYAKLVLKKIKKRFKLCILTSNSDIETKAILKQHKFPKFDMVVSLGHVKSNKTKGLRKILKTLHLKKNEVLYVGDSDFDIKAAKDLGVKIIVNTAFHTPRLIKKADFVIKDLRKVLKIVNKVGR